MYISQGFYKSMNLNIFIYKIPDPPAISYVDRLEDLISDWDHGSSLVINDIKILIILAASV